MSHELTLLGYHAEKVRKNDPLLECPIRLAHAVLSRIGVELSEEEFKIFAKDFTVAEKASILASNDAEVMK